MPDIVFPARLTVDKEEDANGLPILAGDLTIAPEVEELQLPGGPKGAKGPRGRPRATFAKQGEIANAAARPSGLTADDRGKWWHRLDNDGMDVWTGVGTSGPAGTGWALSPGAVGPQGADCDPNVLTSNPVVADEKITLAGLKISGTGATQVLTPVVPAGFRGAVGPDGASGDIRDSPDYDDNIGPIQRSTFGWNRGPRKFQIQRTPYMVGPWTIPSASFVTEPGAPIDADYSTAATITIPALPFLWRPVVYGHMYAFSSASFARIVVRMTSLGGPICAAGLGVLVVNTNNYMPIAPMYGDINSSKTLTPSSTFDTVEPGNPCTLFVNVERQQGVATNIKHSHISASVLVWAQPV